ncbi:cysteine hydrolase family protein [Silvimonas iriomotensis]|uniref:cysteine hydrolase family protein n=1 Tax=Silvimonas iriomotensis TaxID=449662 RepID=UPI001E59A416|nr:isochorismatase family cysteine hydrolase [Silvimonas iriomotensis]
MIDMQRDFLAPEGASGVSGFDLAPLRTIIPRLQNVLAAARRHGVRVFHTREGHRTDLADLCATKQQRTLQAGAEIGARGPLGRFMVRGEFGHDFIDELQPVPGEPIIDKPGYGAFYATDLEHMLRNMGITHVLLAGVTTQCCVHSTLREAVDRGFFCLTLADCCASFEPALHDATLQIIASEAHLFGWITEGEQVVAALANPALETAPGVIGACA